MNSREFCEIAAAQLVADMIDAKILYKDRADDVEGCIKGALQCAVQHALLNLNAALLATLESNVHASDSLTELDMLDFIKTGNHPDA